MGESSPDKARAVDGGKARQTGRGLLMGGGKARQTGRGLWQPCIAGVGVGYEEIMALGVTTLYFLAT